MADIKQRFRELDLLERNLHWSQVLDRDPGPPPTEPRHKLAVIAVAIAVALAGTSLAFRAFVTGPQEPATPQPTGDPGLSSTRTFTSPEAPWTFEYPSGWDVETIQAASPELIANTLRTTVANRPLPDMTGSFGPNSGGGEEFTSALGDAGVVVLIQRFWSHGGDIGVDPRGPGPFVEDAQSPGWTFRERLRCGPTLCFNVVEWIGPAASEEDRAASVELAESARLTDFDRWTETDGTRVTLHDEANGFTVTYPSEWHVADDRINTWVTSPEEILALATYPLRSGGHAVTDFQLPSKAAADLGPDDILIWVSEEGAESQFPDRPERFGPLLVCDGFTRLCPEPHGDQVGVPGIHGWWIPFGDQGRGFYAFVGMGERVYAEEKRAQWAWAVLDSLRFARPVTAPQT